MAPLSLVSVNLATVVIESMLYGMFLLLSGASTYFHYSRVSRERGGHPGGFSKRITPVFCGSMLVSGTITGVSRLTVYLVIAHECATALGHDGIPPLRSICGI